VQKGNKSVTDFLDAFLAQQKANGTFHKLQEEHLKIIFDNLPNEPLLPGDRKM
jgi:polar amino acid transport system substrate-binding protein